MSKTPSFQELILRLHAFWAAQGCVILQPYDVEMGAGTFHPATTLRALGPRPWRAAYVQPSRRPSDGRYGENPNRLGQYYQYQVIIKPSPADAQDLLLDSYRAIGIDPLLHDIRFVEDDWESPTLGAWGLGWEVWCDGMEVSQFTYFQQVGGIPVELPSFELTYGLERLAMYVQGVERVYDLDFNGAGVTYGDVFLRSEREYSAYSFEHGDPALLTRQFEDAERECGRLTEQRLALPAYDQCIKASHLFNLLDASGAISVAERAAYIGRVRTLAKGCCEAWLAGENGWAVPRLPDAGSMWLRSRMITSRISGAFALCRAMPTGGDADGVVLSVMASGPLRRWTKAGGHASLSRLKNLFVLRPESEGRKSWVRDFVKTITSFPAC